MLHGHQVKIIINEFYPPSLVHVFIVCVSNFIIATYNSIMRISKIFGNHFPIVEKGNWGSMNIHIVVMWCDKISPNSFIKKIKRRSSLGVCLSLFYVSTVFGPSSRKLIANVQVKLRALTVSLNIGMMSTQEAWKGFVNFINLFDTSQVL